MSASTVCWSNLSCVTQAAPRPKADHTTGDILAEAREQVLERGEGLSREQVLEVLRLPTTDSRTSWHWPMTFGCAGAAPKLRSRHHQSQDRRLPEDCHFCAQSGLFASRYGAPGWTSRSLVEAAKQTAKTGATEFCIVAAVRGPDERLLAQVAAGIEAIRNEVDIHVACSLGMLTAEQVQRLADMGVHRYNHNLETSRSFFPNVVTTHTWEERWETLRMVRDAGMEVCCGGILGMGRPSSNAPNSPPTWPNSTRTKCR